MTRERGKWRAEKDHSQEGENETKQKHEISCRAFAAERDIRKEVSRGV